MDAARTHALFGREFFRRLARLTRPYWVSGDWKAAWALLALVLAMELLAVAGVVKLSDAQRQIFDALQGKDSSHFFRALYLFFGVALGYLFLSAYKYYYRQMLEIRWRRWLTDVYLARWTGSRAYYRLELHRERTDNPDQRIAEDVRDYVGSTLNLFLDFVSSVATLVSFIGILWGLSGSWRIALGGSEVHVPGFMVWVALLYAVVSTWITHRVGRRLVPINFDQQRFEADFRFHLVRMRENAEAVAFHRGEEREREGALARFHHVVDNWWRLMKAQKNLAIFSVGFSQANAIVPLLVAAPGYFLGRLTLGDVMQTSVAYGQVSGSLTFFVDAYASIASWRASVERLVSFTDALDLAHAAAARDDAIRVRPSADGALHLGGVTLALPDGRVIVHDATGVIGRGDRVVLSGPSGAGKSTLFRALAGLWPFGRGRVELPEQASRLFLPQRPYLPIGTLRGAVSYPAREGAFADARIAEVLGLVGLGGFAGRLAEIGHWAQQMSGGEQQRLALARVLLHEPDWVFLDEATAALDPAMERRMYELLDERLPGATVVSIAHRPELARHQTRRWRLVPSGGAMALDTGMPVALEA